MTMNYDEKRLQEINHHLAILYKQPPTPISIPIIDSLTRERDAILTRIKYMD